MKQVIVTALINAPRERVFAAMAYPQKSSFTNNRGTRMEIVGEQTTGVGTIYRETFTLPFGLRFHFDEVVTEWAESERLAVRALSSWDMEGVGALSSERGGTRLTYTVRYRPSGKWGWLIPGWLVQLGSQHMLASIRRANEMQRQT